MRTLKVRLSDEQDGWEVLSDDGLEAFVSMKDVTTVERPDRLMRETIERVQRVMRVRRFARLLDEPDDKGNGRGETEGGGR